MKVKIITGYTPIPDHPRSAEEYGALGEKLFKGVTAAPVRAFYTPLQSCWLYRGLFENDFKVKHYEGDNPAKNTLEYHIVQHQKSEWLLGGMLTDDYEADTYVWLDYGIAHQPGVTSEVVNDFVKRIAKGDFAIPGCWPLDTGPVEMQAPNWRFCGSMLIVPREHVQEFDTQMKLTARRIMERTRRISWEVNTLARLERLKRLPIRWYKADHDSSQFTNYEAPHADGIVQPVHPVRNGQGTEGDERVGVLAALSLPV